MIIENKRTFIFFFIVLALTGCFMNKEPKFTISGEPEIINNLVINIKTISNDTGIEECKMQTLLYKGSIYDLNLDDPKVIAYEIFASFNDEWVGKSVRYDNAMRFYPEDHINIVKVHGMNNGSIKIFHIYDKRSLDLDLDLTMPNITTLESNMNFNAFIKEKEIFKDSSEYIYYRDAFFKNYQ